MYTLTNTFKKNIDTYIFILCVDYKNQLSKIEKNLNIKIPKEIYKKFSSNKTDYLDLYIENKHLILVGYGKNKLCEKKYLYEISGMIGKNISTDDKKYFIYGAKDLDMIIAQISGLMLGYYNFNKYKTDIQNKEDKTKIYLYSPIKKFNKYIEERMSTVLIQNEIRNLVNEPANILNSSTYEKYIRKNIPGNINIKVYNNKDLEKLGLNLILAVNKGSHNPAKLIVLNYTGNPSAIKKNNICLIGKGVMFDTGGLDIKYGDFADMKTDMTGSAIAFGVIKACAELKKKVNVIALLPIVENSVDATSMKPGDIVKCYNGKTVEIIDTDAEGRLILADAIAFSIKYKPTLIIDIATLTGDAASIFGELSSVIIGNNNQFIEKYKKISNDENEKVWELPMWEEYVELTKSSIADYKNYTIGIKAGAIMGGAFLSNFIPIIDKKPIPWVHLDIAGVSYLKDATETRNAGATGETFHSIYNLIIHD